MRGIRILATTAVMMCVFALSAANAQPSAPPLAVELDRLLTSGEYDTARQLLRRSLGSAPDAVLHRGHFEGLILVRQRRYDDAARVFRSVLTLNPDFVPSRAELAKLLYRLGDTDGADHHLRAISLGAEDIGLERFAQTFLDRMERERPYGFSGYVSVLPSTNINRGTANVLFGQWTISDDSRQKSGVGIGAGIDGFYRWNVDENAAVVFSGALDGKKYSGSSDFDELGLTTSLSYLRKIGGFQVRAGPVGEYRLVAWEPYLTRFGASGGVFAPLGKRTALSLGLSVLRQDFPTFSLRDGWLAHGSATLRHMLSPSFGLSGTIGFTSERTRIDRLDHDDLRFAVQTDREWSGGLLTTAFASFETHRYRGAFIRGTSTKRRDRRWAIGGRIAHRSFSLQGFAPELRYEFARQYSNVSFYDYSSHDLSVTLTRRF